MFFALLEFSHAISRVFCDSLCGLVDLLICSRMHQCQISKFLIDVTN